MDCLFGEWNKRQLASELATFIKHAYAHKKMGMNCLRDVGNMIVKDPFILCSRGGISGSQPIHAQIVWAQKGLGRLITTTMQIQYIRWKDKCIKSHVKNSWCGPHSNSGSVIELHSNYSGEIILTYSLVWKKESIIHHSMGLLITLCYWNMMASPFILS